jgi:hypothetical protein
MPPTGITAVAALTEGVAGEAGGWTVDDVNARGRRGRVRGRQVMRNEERRGYYIDLATQVLH